MIWTCSRNVVRSCIVGRKAWDGEGEGSLISFYVGQNTFINGSNFIYWWYWLIVYKKLKICSQFSMNVIPNAWDLRAVMLIVWSLERVRMHGCDTRMHAAPNEAAERQEDHGWFKAGIVIVWWLEYAAAAGWQSVLLSVCVRLTKCLSYQPLYLYDWLLRQRRPRQHHPSSSLCTGTHRVTKQLPKTTWPPQL